jgi:O-antigen/teichoic acid export membrane protein
MRLGRLLELVSGRLLGRSLAGFAVRGVEVLAKLGLYILAARQLGGHESGLFFLCLTWIHLLSTAARLGVDRALIRHVGADVGSGHRPAARAAIRRGMAWVTLAGAVAAGLTGLVADPVARLVFRQPDLAPVLLLSAAVILPQTMAFTLSAVLAGLHRPVASQVVQHVAWPLITVAPLVFLPVTHAVDLMVWLLAALCACLVLALVFLWQAAPHLRGDAAGATGEPVPHLWRTARPQLVVEIVQVAISTIPVLALGIVAPPEAVAGFSLASRISVLVWVVLISLGTIAGPQFADLHRRGEWVRLRQLNRGVQAIGAVVAGTACLVMLAAPGLLLGLIDPVYVAAALALQILALGQLINSMFSCQDVFLAMTGHGGVQSRLNIVQMVVCMVLTVVLVPLLQVEGAALAAAAPIVIGALGTAAVVRATVPQAAARFAPAVRLPRWLTGAP